MVGFFYKFFWKFYSFLLRQSSNLYKRRASKIISIIVSLFTSIYVHSWHNFFPQTVLQFMPCFDARSVAYPTIKNVMDYFKWRHVDCKLYYESKLK